MASCMRLEAINQTLDNIHRETKRHADEEKNLSLGSGTPLSDASLNIFPSLIRYPLHKGSQTRPGQARVLRPFEQVSQQLVAGSA